MAAIVTRQPSPARLSSIIGTMLGYFTSEIVKLGPFEYIDHIIDLTAGAQS